MTSLGIYLRWSILIILIIYKIYFVIHGFSTIHNKSGEMGGLYICNNSNEMLQCSGLDDYTTCGNGINCITSSCGRPLFPGIGISYAGSSDPYDENAATSTKSFITTLAVVYSLIPFLLQMYFGIHFLAWGNLVSLTRLGIMGFLSVMNDAVLKNIVKQPRPTGSCLYFHAYGMPSGHATTSIGLLTFILLELLMYHPNLFGNKLANRVSSDTIYQRQNSEAPTQHTDITAFTWGYGWQQQQVSIIETRNNNLGESMMESERENLPPTSLDSTTIEPHEGGRYFQIKWLHHYYALLWTALLLPIPFSRPYLSDHTSTQVLVGSIVGCILGCIWYFGFIRGLIFHDRDSNRGLMKRLVNSRPGKAVGLNLGVDRWRFPVVKIDCDDGIQEYFDDDDTMEVYIQN